ncbi:MAG: hypothetical protein EAZ87_13485 [Nostocales cyanobacterium]|nr:MAG: hypothetical protein EAZ87_13485 [Nostocales cyanobacterium]
MDAIFKVWDIIWDNDLFHWANVIVLGVAVGWEIFTVVQYSKYSNRDIEALKHLSGKRSKIQERDLSSWTNEHLETKNNQPIKTNGQYNIKQYPEILTHSTRSNLRFVGTLCTAIGVLGTFYGIQAGIGNIPLNDLNDTQSLMKGVSGLLDGMKTAFSTSLMGLGSGSVFTIVLFVTDSIRQSKYDKITRYLHNITLPKKDNREDAFK